MSVNNWFQDKQVPSVRTDGEEAAFLSAKSKYQATQVPPSPAFRSENFAAARAVRERLGARFVPRPLLDRVLRMLADYRAENPAGQ